MNGFIYGYPELPRAVEIIVGLSEEEFQVIREAVASPEGYEPQLNRCEEIAKRLKAKIAARDVFPRGIAGSGLLRGGHPPHCWAATAPGSLVVVPMGLWPRPPLDSADRRHSGLRRSGGQCPPRPWAERLHGAVVEHSG